MTCVIETGFSDLDLPETTPLLADWRREHPSSTYGRVQYVDSLVTRRSVSEILVRPQSRFRYDKAQIDPARIGQHTYLMT